MRATVWGGARVDGGGGGNIKYPGGQRVPSSRHSTGPPLNAHDADFTLLRTRDACPHAYSAQAHGAYFLYTQTIRLAICLRSVSLGTPLSSVPFELGEKAA